MSRFSPILFKILLLGVFGSVLAGPVLPMPLNQMAERAELVVHADVIGKSVQKDDEGRIYTKVQLNIRDIWKGELSSTPFTLVHSGGILGNMQSSAQGEVSFRMGEEVVLFMIINSRGEGVSLAMNQGKFQVERDSKNTAYVRNPFHGGRPPNAEKSSGYRLPTQLPLTIETLKRQVLRQNS